MGEMHDMSDAHMSTECEYLHPECPTLLKTKYAMTNAKLAFEELLSQQLSDFRGSNESDIDLTKLNLKVLRKYPRAGEDFPCIVISRSNHKQQYSGLGEVIGEGTGADAGKETRAVRQEERISIEIFTLNADERDALYTYVTQTIAGYRPELGRLGLESVLMVDGNDDEIYDQVFTQSYIYHATQIYAVLSEMQIEDEYIIAKAVHTAIRTPLLGGKGIGVEYDKGGS